MRLEHLLSGATEIRVRDPCLGVSSLVYAALFVALRYTPRFFFAGGGRGDAGEARQVDSPIAQLVRALH